MYISKFLNIIPPCRQHRQSQEARGAAAPRRGPAAPPALPALHPLAIRRQREVSQ